MLRALKKKNVLSKTDHSFTKIPIHENIHRYRISDLKRQVFPFVEVRIDSKVRIF